MSDLKTDLRSYIEALAEPITVDEVTRTAPEPRRNLRRPLLAALAGAAVVVIAVMLAILPSLMRDDEEVVDQTTTTTTTPPQSTTTTLPPTGLVMVPELLGMAEANAVAALEALGLTADVQTSVTGDAEVGTVVAQFPAAGDQIPEGTSVAITVAVAARCNEFTQDLPPVASGEQDVTVLYGCGGDFVTAPNVVYSLVRRVPASLNRYEAVLAGLLQGVTEEERRAGFGSMFDASSTDALISAEISSGHLVADFGPAAIANNATTSTGSMFFTAELLANLFRFSEVDSVEFRIDGSCDAWARSLEGEGCTVTTRAQWDAMVERWNLELLRSLVTVNPIPTEGLGSGYLASELTANGDTITWYAADGSTSQVVVRFGISVGPSRAVVSDRRGGLVYENAGGLYWLRPGVTNPEQIVDMALPAGGASIDVIDDVELPFRGPILVVRPNADTTPIVYDLGDRAFLPEEDDFFAAVAAQRQLLVRLDGGPAGGVNAAGEPTYGDPNPTYLVVENREGDELIRTRMSTEDEPAVWIDDFDGSRVLVTRSPLEPASAPQTSFVLELSCGWECTTTVYTAGYADLSITGPVAGDGPLVADGPWPELASCSAAGAELDPPALDLPGAVADVRRIIWNLASRCSLASLDAFAADQGTELVFGHQALPARPISATESEQGPYPAGDAGIVGALLDALRLPPGTYDDAGSTVHVWPAIASPEIDWATMTDAEAAALEAAYSRDLVAESRALGWYAGLYVEVEGSRWTFFGVNLT